MFINITTPSDTQKGPLRRAIRSQAALSSATCRKNTIAAKASSSSDSPEDQIPPRVRRRSKAKAIKDNSEAPSSSSVSVSSRRNSSSASSLSPAQQYHLVSPHSGQSIIQFDSSLTFPYADAWHAKIPQLVDTYLTYFAPSAQDPSIYPTDQSFAKNYGLKQFRIEPSFLRICFLHRLIHLSHGNELKRLRHGFALKQCVASSLDWIRPRA
ncbi:hypothetical protein KCU78_g17025, partial [Aureobasidium melanogenum]